MGLIGLHVGQCGVQVGVAFWQLIDEIAASDISVSGIQGFVTATCSYPHTRRPLAVSVDLDSRPLQAWSGQKFGMLEATRPECYYSTSRRGSGGNFANGFKCMQHCTTADMSVSNEPLIDSVMEGIRRQAEACLTRAHFLITHSLAGGTGSGGSSLILQRLRDTYGSGSYITTLSVAPSSSGDLPCQAFNSVLAGTALQDLSDCALVIQNAVRCPGSTGASKDTCHTLEQTNVMAARSLAGLLLPLGPTESGSGCNRVADLVESVTPQPAFRFSEVFVSRPEVGESRTMKAVAHHFCRNVPRYSATGGLILTSNALMIARAHATGDARVVGCKFHFLQLFCRGSSDGIDGLKHTLTQGQRALLPEDCALTLRHCSPCARVLADATLHGCAMQRRGRREPLPQFSPPGALIYAANRSSMGDFWLSCARQARLKLQSNAYVHWYEAAGLSKDDLQHAVSSMEDTGSAYTWWCR